MSWIVGSLFILSLNAVEKTFRYGHDSNEKYNTDFRENMINVETTTHKLDFNYFPEF